MILLDTSGLLSALDTSQPYHDECFGLTDASIVVLADRYAVSEALTLDQRHFRAMRPGRRKRFAVLPFDR